MTCPPTLREGEFAQPSLITPELGSRMRRRRVYRRRHRVSRRRVQHHHLEAIVIRSDDVIVSIEQTRDHSAQRAIQVCADAAIPYRAANT